MLAALTAALVVTGSTVALASIGDDAQETTGRPNIIYFLVDDMSADLLPYMDSVRGLGQGGAAFENYVVSNALCCPSRATMFTGRHPHNTGVLTNEGPNGGYAKFKALERTTYATALSGLGYRTGYLGKYLNGYPMNRDFHVPAGWNEWHVADNGGYNEYDYRLSRYVEGEGKRLSDGGGRYLVDVLGKRAVGFLERSRDEGKPFFLQVAPFSPHSGLKGEHGPRFPAAHRDRPGGEFPHGDCGGADCRSLRVDDALGKAFDEDTGDKPPWVRRTPLTDTEKRGLTKDFRDRVRMVQSIDDMVERVLASMTDPERANTYVMFGSDNGFHLGQHRMVRGKTSPYTHDVRLPFIVKRPASTPGGDVRVPEIVQNVDLYPTFVDIANGPDDPPTSRDGRSLLPLIHGRHPSDWRNAALVEHWKPGEQAPGRDPDAVGKRGNSQPPTYRALRTTSELLVDYDAYQAFEYYDLRRDPEELSNKTDHPRIDALREELAELANCGKDGHPSCWAAAHVT